MLLNHLRIYLIEMFVINDYYFVNLTLQVVHPIHDQVFYLTAYHKKKLKQEFGQCCTYLNFIGLVLSLVTYFGTIGIEPWTFVQKLGEAVFIPAGCPHQVRNLKVQYSFVTFMPYHS